MKGDKHLVLLEEQTILSRERTMQQYVATGLAFIGVGLVVMRLFIDGFYTVLSVALILLGFWQIYLAYSRFRKYRHMARKLRRKEKNLGLEIGE